MTEVENESVLSLHDCVVRRVSGFSSRGHVFEKFEIIVVD